MLLAAALASVASAGERGVKERDAAAVFEVPAQAALARAACAGDRQALQAALASGADLEGEGAERTTPLLWAVGCGSEAGVEALLEAGADPNHDNGRFSPVFAAATRHDPACLRVLLARGGDANALDRKSGKTAIAAALALGVHGRGWAGYELLLDRADLERADSSGWTIAFQAAALNQYDRVAELLERGYSRDLEYLGRLVSTGRVDLEPQRSWQAKVIAMLEARGVRFPVAPRHPAR
ncbi:MAG: ankyrin repeat domain-containing protein [Anaeromyxobacter sp.]